MFRKLKSAHGAGYRAGRAETPTQLNSDGTKYIVQPANPFMGFRNYLLRLAWDEGYIKGAKENLHAWLKSTTPERKTNVIRSCN